MPNYRQKNKNRNRNKNRNKQANQQQQQQKQQQKEEREKQQQNQKTLKAKEKEHEETAVKVEVEEREVENFHGKEELKKTKLVEQVVPHVKNVEEVKLVQSENESLGNDSTTEQPSTATAPAIVDSDACNETRENVEQNAKNFDEASEITKPRTSIGTATITITDQQQITHEEMGAKGSKLKDDQLGAGDFDDSARNRYREMQPLRTIMATLDAQERQENEQQQNEQHDKQEQSDRIEREEPQAAEPPTEAQNILNAQNREVKVIFHRIELETETDGSVNSPISAILPTLLEQRYRVESPINELNSRRTSARSSIVIQELSDGSLSDTNESSNDQQAAPLVNEVDDSESERETEISETATTTAIAPTSSSITETPLCGDQLTMPLSSIGTSCQDDLRQRRVQKRAALESHFLPQLICPRYLDCILEENSELSDGSHGQQNVINQTPPESPSAFSVYDSRARRADARFPKSNLDFSRKHKHGQLPKAPTMPGAICEEPQTIIVETKHIEKSVILTSNQSPKTSAEETDCEMLTIASASDPAEIVFIDSASSSMSDLLEEFSSSDADAEADMEDGGGDESSMADGDETTLSTLDLETDVSDLISSNGRNSSAASTLTGGSRENTPVNQSTETTQLIALAKTIEQNDSGSGDRENSPAPNDNSINAMDSFSFRSVAIANYDENHEASASATKTIDDDDEGDGDGDGERTKEPLRSTCDSGKRLPIAGSCSLSAVENVDAKSLLETLEAEMSNVRDVLSSLSELTVTPPVVPIRRLNARPNASSQSPPPLPPPPTYLDDTHYPLGTNNIDTIHQNNHLEQLKQQQQQTANDPKILSQYTHVEACAESEKPRTPTSSSSATLVRQESADSHCSDSTVHSQCTAINLCATPQEHEFVDTQPTRMTAINNSSSYISDTLAIEKPSTTKAENNLCAIKKLRLLCTENLASMPYGEFVLKELANVAHDLSEVQLKQRKQLEEQLKQHQERQRHERENNNKMPYPLPDMPKIEQLHLSSNGTQTGKIAITPMRPAPLPPVPTAQSTSRLGEGHQIESSWLAMPTEMDPKLLVCLSPAQHAYIEDQMKSTQHQHQHQLDELLDAHQKYIDRRGYHEYTKEQVRVMNTEKLKEHQILETAAVMKKLRKSLTPSPPPVPPPPVPLKSCETAAKAQSQKKILTTAMDAGENDAIVKNANDQCSTFSNARERIISSGDSDDNNNGEITNKKHRLLAIIHDNTKAGSTIENEVQKISRTTTTSTTPSLQNISKQVERNSSNSANITIDSSQEASFQSNAQQVEHSRGSEKSKASTGDMQSVESELARMFPIIGERDIFDPARKRYSNIETSSKSTPFCSQLMSTHPKRYSSFETHSYETKKRTENGEVVYDCTDSKHASHSDGGEIPTSKVITHFPCKVDAKYAFPAPTTDSNAKHEGKRHQQLHTNEPKKMPSTSTSHVDEIMSALKLNTKNIAIETTAPASAPPYFPIAAVPQSERNSFFTHSVTKEQQQKAEDEREKANVERIEKKTFEERYESAESRSKRIGTAQAPAAGSYEEFRQRAKAAADAIYAGDEQRQPSTFHSGDHEKHHKDFDMLSKQLNATLKMGKPQSYSERGQSSSLHDLNRMQMQFNRHIKDLKRQRHEHMIELEQEIERSMRSRQLRQQQQQQQQQQQHDQPDYHQQSAAARLYDVPICIENAQPQSPYEVSSAVTSQQLHYQDRAREMRRAESMGNLPTSPLSPQQTQQQQQQQQQQKQQMPVPKPRERSYSNNAIDDDWARYASDLGNSENIARPFAREVEICYQKQRARTPRTIRAPRLSVSTNDIYNHYTDSQSYDSLNAYNVRRTHAPMMSAAAPQASMQKTKPQSLSCYSVLERDPNPTYISTTSRRGVSPAPPSTISPQLSHAADHVHFRVSEHEMRQRRLSLPRELQAKQLKYIQSKEEELKTEFERLQSERRRLMDEMQRETAVNASNISSNPQAPLAPALSAPQHPPRQSYRPVPPRRLPTLSEDEVFRQQMAEEWLSKVAEREERRLHNIIKLSKGNETAAGVHQVPIELTTSAPSASGTTKPDIEREFLKRVQERRSKLAMPADSDWESGAESHPQPTLAGHTSETEELPTIRIYEGKSEADLRHLPKHLREFAKFSNHQTDPIEGGHRELHQEEERRQEATDNMYSSASKKSSIMKSVKITRQHPYATTSNNQTTSKQSNLNGDQHVFADSTTTFNSSTSTNENSPKKTTALPTTMTTTTTTPRITTSKSVHFSPFLFDKLPTPTPPFMSSSSASSPFTPLKPFPPFGDAFANSPFKRQIYQEFDAFWRRFNNAAFH